VLFAKFFDIVAVNDSAMEAMLSNYNIPTCLTMMENDPRIYYETGVPKDIDILFSGYLHKENRLVLLEAVKKRFSDYDCVFLDMVDKYLEPDEHADLTRRSKIVLNFAQGFLPFTKLLHANAYYAAPVPRILKQRILSSGLCGTACVSEFFAAAPNMFPYLRTFRSRTDLLTHLDQLLSDEKLLKDYTKQHAQHIQNRYSQSIMVRELSYKLHSVAPRAETLPVLIRVPWSRHYSVNATKSRLRKATTIKAIWSEFTWCRKGDDSFPAMPISTWLTAAAVALISRLVWSIARYIGQQPWARNRFNSLRNKRNTTNLI
jgi:hypothetical protein